jgi:hypothetical protein
MDFEKIFHDFHRLLHIITMDTALDVLAQAAGRDKVCKVMEYAVALTAERIQSRNEQYVCPAYSQLLGGIYHLCVANSEASGLLH